MSTLMAKMMSGSTPTNPGSTGTSSPSLTPPPASLPVRTIPGGYGWPLLGPISDRLDYNWFQGPNTFFTKRIEKHKSTVFRTNVPPCFPFFLGVNPNVVAVLDVKSFSHLFDMEIVEKANVLVGDFMPSVKYTGDMRVCAYLDTSEPKHTQIKNFSLDILKRSSKTWVPTLVNELNSMFETFESDISKSNSASLLPTMQKFLFNFFSLSLLGANPSASPEIANSGYVMLDTWLAIQLAPTVSIGLLQPLEEIFVHSFNYPFFLVKGSYEKLIQFVKNEAKEVLNRGKSEFGLTEQEAIHNLLFILGFNAFGGFSIFLPTLLGNLGDEKNAELQEKLRNEVREKVGLKTENLSFESVKEMELVQSFVYETLRLSPPVPSQYARARKDFKLSSHDSVYEIKKGELLCGYQPLVMRDPKVFDDPEKFVLERFTKEKGKELLNYLFWSNGPQTGRPTESNKQCAAKDVVTLTASLIVAYIFQRYDSVSFSSGSLTSVKKAS
ncbi:PREDICTED: fatty acid hydroperoxide lyase, chloroplastic [Nicotiana attenuata]|uniref:Hydroperoxide lyase n=1 Tax=Nicotiana attenuata TaxID=49451 RepID=Q93YF8_NICAT|nr:PREDICTED: fatty acid hydroperoxide lyase, chloroplastic [Nicotiana attenuata]OIT20947.1 fatty acid hydroperoxide lyase, chloroplastic [Nicotiana attenuata]CAC91565.1 hydroperoxide lyase [Nicotiana attenuata]